MNFIRAKLRKKIIYPKKNHPVYNNFTNFAVVLRIQICNIISFYVFYFANYRYFNGYGAGGSGLSYCQIDSSYNKVKGEPFECGIPTHGSSWLPVHVGYYLFAILFLMFDVETMFLYPWAVVVKEFGVAALLSIGFFLLVLVFGLAYAWRKGALEWK